MCKLKFFFKVLLEIPGKSVSLYVLIAVNYVWKIHGQEYMR